MEKSEKPQGEGKQRVWTRIESRRLGDREKKRSGPTTPGKRRKCWEKEADTRRGKWTGELQPGGPRIGRIKRKLS